MLMSVDLDASLVACLKHGIIILWRVKHDYRASLTCACENIKLSLFRYTLYTQDTHAPKFILKLAILRIRTYKSTTCASAMHSYSAV